MTNIRIVPLSAALLTCLLAVRSATAQLTVPAADGSDGVLMPTVSTSINLNAATTGNWAAAGTGTGVYDPEKWAVVFKYQKVVIPAGVTVTFLNNATRAPVVWLVQSNVDISGSVNLSGSQNGPYGGAADPGPGGYRSGYSINGGAQGPGFGIGGGLTFDTDRNAAHANGGGTNMTYGMPSLFQLIGGSGSRGLRGTAFGGVDSIGNNSGGGAILIACAGDVVLNGGIFSQGSASSSWLYQSAAYSAGGAIRVVAPRILGTGQINALGPASQGNGWIALHANEVASTIQSFPDVVRLAPGPVAKLWRDEAEDPFCEIVSVAATPAPIDPQANMDTTADLIHAGDPTVQVTVETRNILTTGTVLVRVAPKYGTVTFAPLTFQSGTYALATWSGTITLDQGHSALQVIARETE